MGKSVTKVGWIKPGSTRVSKTSFQSPIAPVPGLGTGTPAASAARRSESSSVSDPTARPMAFEMASKNGTRRQGAARSMVSLWYERVVRPSSIVPRWANISSVRAMRSS